MSRVSSVKELLEKSDLDSAVAEAVDERMRSRQIVKRLIAMRVSCNRSQAEIANRMNCTQSKISKLENGTDDELRLSELRDYLSALDRDMSLFICGNDWQSIQQIKFCATMISRCLRDLVERAGEDATIKEGVSKAHIETLVNLITTVVASAENLPSLPQMLPEIISADERQLDSSADDGDDDLCEEESAIF